MLALSSVSAEKGMLLRLDFRDEFKLEDSTDCRYDFLEVRDGQHGFSNLLGNFCGTNFPPEITSKTRYLWLRFHSDESIEGKGFRAVWSMIPRQTNIRKSRHLLPRSARPSRCHSVIVRFSRETGKIPLKISHSVIIIHEATRSNNFQLGIISWIGRGFVLARHVSIGLGRWLIRRQIGWMLSVFRSRVIVSCARQEGMHPFLKFNSYN